MEDPQASSPMTQQRWSPLALGRGAPDSHESPQGEAWVPKMEFISQGLLATPLVGEQEAISRVSLAWPHTVWIRLLSVNIN